MTKLREIMLRHGVSPHVAEAVMLECSKRTHKRVNPGAVWNVLLSKAKHVRLNITSNRPKRLTQPINYVYEHYYALVIKAIAKITEASTLTLDDGEPVHPRDIEAKRAKSNAKRAAEGKPLLAECRQDAWYTWIDPHEREEMYAVVSTFYARHPTKARGKRFEPFVTNDDRVALNTQYGMLQADMLVHREMHRCAASKVDGQYTWAETPYSALQLAATAAALKEARQRVATGAAIDVKLPKDWRLLCPTSMIQRLREADDNPPAARLTPDERITYMPPQWVNTPSTHEGDADN